MKAKDRLINVIIQRPQADNYRKQHPSSEMSLEAAATLTGAEKCTSEEKVLKCHSTEAFYGTTDLTSTMHSSGRY